MPSRDDEEDVMSALRQITLVTAMGLRNVPQRPGGASVVVIGIAGVVAVLVSMLTLGASVAESLRAAGREDRAIVLREGSESEAASALFAAQAQAIADAPGVARTPAGKPAATADMLATVNLPRKLDGALAGVTVRGVSPEAATVRPEIELVKGRMFTPGLHELIVGRVLQQQFDGLTIGDSVGLRGGEWQIVGVYETGNMSESMLLTDAATLMSAYRRSLFNSTTVLLESPEAFGTFKDALTSDPTLAVSAMRESEYYSRTSGLQEAFLVLSYAISGIMAAGALFGALNTLYSAVSARSVEIATLRAVGFSGSSVVVAVLAEALLLAALGGLAGAAIAWGALSGHTFSLGSTEGAGALATALHVTPQLVGIGFAWALIMGVLGGLLPAIRAARLPVATALRAL
jgi:putative ABC transport system permease protein